MSGLVVSQNQWDVEKPKGNKPVIIGDVYILPPLLINPICGKMLIPDGPVFYQLTFLP